MTDHPENREAAAQAQAIEALEAEIRRLKADASVWKGRALAAESWLAASRAVPPAAPPERESGDSEDSITRRIRQGRDDGFRSGVEAAAKLAESWRYYPSTGGSFQEVDPRRIAALRALSPDTAAKAAPSPHEKDAKENR